MKSSSSFLVLIFLVFAMADATAAEQEYQSPGEFIKTLSPTPQVDQVVEGDLNGDGLSDRAILAGGQQPSLYILLQMPDHAFRLAVSSRSGALDILEGSASAKASIEKSSVYVWVNWATEQSAISFLSYHTARYQFMLYKGAWRMIGLTYHSGGTNPRSADRPGDPHEEKTDINLLTGDIISSYTTTGKAGVPHSTSERLKAPGRVSCELADFEFVLPHCLEDWKTSKGLPVTALLVVPPK